MTSDYAAFRGKCKEMAEAAVAADPSLTLVRGHYHDPDPAWGKQAHWWTVRQDGSVYDPTALQFPSHGIGGHYEPFDGMVECAQCGAQMPEADVVYTDGRYAFCSYQHYGQFVGAC